MLQTAFAAENATCFNTRMATPGDFLEQLWTEVINLDPTGHWLVDLARGRALPSHLIPNAQEAARRVLASGASRLDLGRVARWLRYEKCSGTLYALEDPGLKKNKLSGLHEAFAGIQNARRRETEFLESLWDEIRAVESLSVDWAPSNMKPDDSFGDVVDAASRLLGSGADRKDLAVLAAWHLYDSCFQTLRLASEHYGEVDEILGLFGQVLGAEPTGNEARPGSWPQSTVDRQTQTPALPTGKSDAVEPLFTCRGCETLVFSTDSQRIGVCGKTGPVRVIRANDGVEVAVCEAGKGEIFSHEFSPDGDTLVVLSGRYISFFDAGTGALVRQVVNDGVGAVQWWRTDGGSVLLFVRELLSESAPPSYRFELRNPESLDCIGEFYFPEIEGQLLDFKHCPDGTKVGLVWIKPSGGYPFMTVWSWPECVLLGKWEMVLKYWAWTRDGDLIATFDAGEHRWDDQLKKSYRIREPGGCALREVLSGEIVWATGEAEDPNMRVAISPDGKWLVTCTHTKGQLAIWSLNERRKVKSITIKGGDWCFGLKFSNDGRRLGAEGYRKCFFWDFARLVEDVSLTPG